MAVSLVNKIRDEVERLGDFHTGPVSITGEIDFIEKTLLRNAVASIDEAEFLAIYHLNGAKALNQAMWVAMAQQLITGE
jgi:hypothetical protein